MKKVLAMAAAAALTCGVSAFAANPFSDVSTSDWAYQAVESLSQQGIVEGYPDGTFKGQQNITRYEMAQIIARMMANEDQYNAEQRATIDKLASEYADELNSLGVRVSNLEKKVGNVRFDGDARMRYTQSYKTVDGTSGSNGTGPSTAAGSFTKSTKDKWDGRIRLGATATVNDNTYVYGRFLTQMNYVDSDSDSDTSMDRLFVHHQFGDHVGMTLGRSELFMGNTGIFYDDAFDGVRANGNFGKVNLEAGYGRMKLWNNLSEDGNSVQGPTNFFKNDTPEAWYVSAKGNIGKATVGADYLQISSDVSSAGRFYKAQSGDDFKFWGANLNVPVGEFAVFGDYYQNTGINGDPQLYTAGLAYGKTVNAKPGSFRIGAQYVKAESGSYLGGTTMSVDPTAISYQYDNKNVKYWQATADVMLAQNLRLHGEYAFNVKADQKNGGSQDYDDVSSVSLNYLF